MDRVTPVTLQKIARVESRGPIIQTSLLLHMNLLRVDDEVFLG